ncbi:MAG: hypothetical protein LBC71_08340 [Oscillospiraceae bacterium]|jgi:hypothetical protein|nr:hypothetical protein [Oscillospiraceae bacterium]
MSDEQLLKAFDSSRRTTSFGEWTREEETMYTARVETVRNLRGSRVSNYSNKQKMNSIPNSRNWAASIDLPSI